ncbi:MAG: DinB family protein [Ruminiclostridium sp.]|nr:DinB family protein [Ruminiclostridium sp.]
MRELCEMIKQQTDANFLNLITAIRTYDRNAPVCGAPAWRYVYHTIHSADKWFFNPYVYDEPDFHEPGMDNPNEPCKTVMTDEQLLEYLGRVREKTARYLDGLTDEMLGERPEGCDMSRLELVLMQFRHISTHIGMLNGLTAEKTGRLPVYVTPYTVGRLDSGYYE